MLDLCSMLSATPPFFSIAIVGLTRNSFPGVIVLRSKHQPWQRLHLNDIINLFLIHFFFHIPLLPRYVALLTEFRPMFYVTLDIVTSGIMTPKCHNRMTSLYIKLITILFAQLTHVYIQFRDLHVILRRLQIYIRKFTDISVSYFQI